MWTASIDDDDWCANKLMHETLCDGGVVCRKWSQLCMRQLNCRRRVITSLTPASPSTPSSPLQRRPVTMVTTVCWNWATVRRTTGTVGGRVPAADRKWRHTTRRCLWRRWRTTTASGSCVRSSRVWTSLSLSLSPSIVMSMSVHLSAAISWKPQGDHHQIFVHVDCGRGSVLLWRSCDMSRTSGFVWMTSYFYTMGQSARIKHDVIFWWSSPDGGTSCTSDSYCFVKNVGPRGKICGLLCLYHKSYFTSRLTSTQPTLFCLSTERDFE